MINFTLTPGQRAAVRRQRSHPFKFLLDKPQEFDRVYAWSSWVDATLLRMAHPTAHRVIDIGCGQAGVAAIQNIIYGCDVYLIDGNRAGDRDSGYAAADTMNHYSTWSDLPNTLESWGCDMTRVHFVEIGSAHEFVWPHVDLVQSLQSCGSHYPIATYEWLYQRVDQPSTRYCFTVGGGPTPVEIPTEFHALRMMPTINYPQAQLAVLARHAMA